MHFARKSAFLPKPLKKSPALREVCLAAPLITGWLQVQVLPACTGNRNELRTLAPPASCYPGIVKNGARRQRQDSRLGARIRERKQLRQYVSKDLRQASGSLSGRTSRNCSERHDCIDAPTRPRRPSALVALVSLTSRPSSSHCVVGRLHKGRCRKPAVFEIESRGRSARYLELSIRSAIGRDVRPSEQCAR